MRIDHDIGRTPIASAGDKGVGFPEWCTKLMTKKNMILLPRSRKNNPKEKNRVEALTGDRQRENTRAMFCQFMEEIGSKNFF